MSNVERGPLRRLASAAMQRVLRRVARAYIAGDTLHHAQAVAAKWAEQGVPSTLGFWDDHRDAPRAVADEYMACIDAMKPTEYVSIKLTALGYSEELLTEVAARAAAKGVRLHFDAMDPESVDPTQEVMQRLVIRWPELPVGCTLPGRWRRSERDADWAVERNLLVRVVKGQFPDDSTLDPRDGFRRVVARLAGRSRHVGVATHDVPLGEECLQLLARAGTNRELELLHGLPSRESLKGARRAGERARIYVGYGRAHLPYVVNRVVDNPRMILWLARDLLRV